LAFTQKFVQDAGEINGVHVSFTIKIQTPMQLQFMILCGHNGTISMDATFGTDDVKFRLFTLMDFNHTTLECQWFGSSQVDKNVRT
jgi:hypothetical protein